MDSNLCLSCLSLWSILFSCMLSCSELTSEQPPTDSISASEQILDAFSKFT